MVLSKAATGPTRQVVNMDLIKPDFTRNIINISATLAEFLHSPNANPTLPDLAAALKSGHRNVALLVLDGMGINPLVRNLPADSFLRRNIARVLTSVFPSTTTNATTTIQTNTYPMEHGWFGWSLYFEELHRAVNIFEDIDSQTGEPIERGYSRRALPTVPFYRRTMSEHTVNVVVPPFWRDEPNRYVWTTIGEFFGQIEAVCKKDGPQFIYAYCTEPDSVMHRFGVTSPEAAGVLRTLNDGLETLVKNTPDTLFVVTADHGQVDVGGIFEIYKDGELCSLLDWPPYLEARAAAFKVKPGCREKFENMFREKYGADFLLLPVEKLIAENYFGGDLVNGHARLLGDCIAVGVTDKIMHLSPRSHAFKGHHTSLTAEMEVPLILLG